MTKLKERLFEILLLILIGICSAIFFMSCSPRFKDPVIYDTPKGKIVTFSNKKYNYIILDTVGYRINVKRTRVRVFPIHNIKQY